MLLAALTACADPGSGENPDPTPDPDPVKTTVRIGGLAGPTSMGLVKLLDDDEKGTAANDYVFTLAAAAEDLTPKLIRGELDMLAVPANLAAVLYHNTQGKVRMLAVNTLGVLNILEKGDAVTSVADLRGKTIYAPASGKGAVPEFTLRYLLTANGIDPDTEVTIEWKTDNTEIVAALNAVETGIAMLPQPYATAAMGAVSGLHVAVNLNDAWNALDNGSRMVTGVLIVRTAFLEENTAAVASFLTEYEASVRYVNANTEEAATLIEHFNIAKAAVAKKALPNCQITFLSGTEMKTAAEGFLGILYAAKPQSVGGSMPDAALYYIPADES